MTEPLPDSIRETALRGIEFPCRAIVRESAADAQGYRATVDVLDRRGDPTSQVLTDVPLDPLWQGRMQSGFFVPPAPRRIVAVVWLGGDAGGPFIAAGADPAPVVPFTPVAGGEAAWQDGEGSEIRFHEDGAITVRNRDDSRVAIAADNSITNRHRDGSHVTINADGSVVMADAAGAEVSIDPAHLVRVASVAESLFAVLDTLLDTLIGATTIPAAVGSPLPYQPAVIAALTAVKTRLAAVMRG